ncbi:MAG: hypothetical protein JO104_04370 [Candidatus Eremiobacteraeota bacterium]|nr:hypothetical protein [Candidatus Eremiobacteraeota bacterium]
MELRPLGFGEIFDRAVTLYIRNFVPFAAIVMVLIVPLAILQYVLDLNSQPEFDALLRLILHPGGAPTHPIPTVFTSPAMVVVFAVLMLVTYAVWPFTLNAVAVGVARLYRSKPVEFRICYDLVLRRWLQVLAMIGVDFFVLLGWYVLAFILIMIFALVVGMFVAVAPGVAFVFGLIFGFAGILLLLPSLAPLFVALTFSMYATVIEERPVIESLALGFGRVFNRTEFWRALLFAIAIGAVMVGGSIIFSIIGLVAAFAHLPLLQAIIESLARALITPFGVVLLAIYYFDVRIRREGFDLEAGLERLAAPSRA